MARTGDRGGSGGRLSRQALQAGAAALMILATAAQAAPTPGPSTSPLGPGWGSGMMGQRAADAHFIVMMIPHHDGAIAMAELARTRAKHPEIKALAAQIEASQTAENAQMRRWYGQWFGTEVPIPGMPMPGMGTSLAVLRSAQDFDRAFIEQMIPHHRMGVMMASHAQWSTQHPQLRELEAAMVKAQTREIAQMEQWYRRWYGASDG